MEDGLTPDRVNRQAGQNFGNDEVNDRGNGKGAQVFELGNNTQHCCCLV